MSSALLQYAQQHRHPNPSPGFYDDQSHQVALRGSSINVTRALRLLSINQPSELCRLFNLPRFELQQLLNAPQYRSFKIPKKRGGKRQLEAPQGLLKYKQRQLNQLLQSYYLCCKPKAVYGFVPHTKKGVKPNNVVQNAAPHVGKRHLLNIDLKNFFQNISAKRVYELFLGPHFGFHPQIAQVLSLLATYQGQLPTGAPTSPVLSNWICYELDQALMAHCESSGITYTRYADDLSFSADLPFERSEIETLVALIEQHQFTINRRKMRLTGPNRQLQVTGIVVNERLNVDRRQLKKIRAMLHDAEKTGLPLAAARHLGIAKATPEQQEQFVAKLQGQVYWVGQVRGKSDPLFVRFLASLALVKEQLPPSENERFDARA